MGIPVGDGQHFACAATVGAALGVPLRTRIITKRLIYAEKRYVVNLGGLYLM